MVSLIALSLVSSLCLSARAVLIEPALQAPTWKYNGTDFWAPVHLESSVYQFQSPAGVVSSSLNRRELPSGGYLGCTVVTLDSSVTALTASVIEDVIAGYAADDVWSAEQFLDCLFIQYSGSSTSVPVNSSFSEFMEKYGVTTSFVSTSFSFEGLSLPGSSSLFGVVSNCELSNGPYVATLPDCEGAGFGMTPVYALHADDYEAFMEGSIPDATESSKHQQMQVSLPGARLPNIIVPTKLGSTDAGAGPLAGLRFAVKDIYHIKGLKTSGGSRAYYETYGYQNYTVETVQLCLDAGAQLIGKTKTIAFALGTPNNGMEVDYQDPWSPRGDGYQTTGGSSSGSGAAVAAYDWVDFALGTDTGGSVRFPARFGGFYGYKPTHGIFNLTGILVAIAEQDTPGFMARSPEIFTRVGSVWAEGKPFTPLPATLPTKMLRYADQPTNLTQPAAKALVEAFFANVSAALGLETTSINMTQAFLDANVSRTDPPQAQVAFMSHVYADQNSVQGWDEIGAPLAEAYGKIPGREGAFPPVDPPVNVSWADGQNATTRARYPESQRRRVAFADFYNSEVLPANLETCSEYIFAHTYHTPPSTVKVTPHTATLVVGWYDGLYANYAGVPEVVVPIGQVEYFSPFTQRIEWQPVTVTFGVAKGCDLVLFELIDRLAAKGLLVEVMPGVVAYPVD